MSNNSNNRENNSAFFRFKYLDLEFELKGSETFVENTFSEIKEYIEEYDLFGIIQYEKDLDFNEKNDDLSEMIEEEEEMTKKEGLIPLDQFLQKYDSDKPQKKVMTLGLYLIEILKKESFKTRDISNLLKINKLSPINSLSTHLTRLRNKNLLSIVGSPGKEAHFTIYKDSLEKIKNFIKKRK